MACSDSKFDRMIKSGRFGLNMIVLVVLILMSACLPGKAVSRAFDVRIVVNTGEVVRRVPRELFGTNIQWEHNGDGLVAIEKGRPRLDKRVLKYVRKAGVSVIRFPGGALANTYRWKNSLGSLGKRRKGYSYSGRKVPSVFGVDEYIRLLRYTGAGGMMTVNVAAGVNNTLDLIEYMNGHYRWSYWGRKRKKHGFKKPVNIIWWEIGNELYSPDAKGHMSATRYAETVRKFASRMKKKDRKIKVGAHLEISFQEAAWMKKVYPHLLSWNKQVLKGAGKYIDFVSVHFYAPFDKLWNSRKLNKLVFSGPEVFLKSLNRIRRLIRIYGKRNTGIVVSEYGTFFGSKIAPDKRIATTENALFSALMLMTMMEQPDVLAANHWSLVNNSHFGSIRYSKGGKLLLRPVYDVIRILSRLSGKLLVSTRVASPGYNVNAKGNIPSLKGLPYIKAITVKLSRSRYRIVVVNRSVARKGRLSVSFGKRRIRKIVMSSFYPTNNEQKWVKKHYRIAGSRKIVVPRYSFNIIDITI